MRAAIYARYSTDLQSSASIEDQIRLCREFVEREDWTLVSTFTDRGLSGASHLRPGYQKLLLDARAGLFDVVVAEALDRISRDQEHVAAFYKQLTFSGVRVQTLSEGQITELHVGLKGTMNAVFLKDLADKTRRGLRGRVEAGRSGGGLSYGYKVVREYDSANNPINGRRRINEAEAAVVHRIFREFVAGNSPRAIAKQLNADGIAGPSGRTWTPSTIHRNTQRGTGTLNNALYVGRLVWNRLRYIKDAQTGRRISRLNPPNLWVSTEVPELRVIDDDLWRAAKQRQEELRLPERSQKIRNALNTRHRAQYLLSGLLVCGSCGARYTLVGEQRYACANHINRGTCSNKRTVARSAIERRVLSGLKDKLLAPDLIATFVKEFREEWSRRAANAELRQADVQARLADCERRIGQVMAAIEQGIVTATTKARLLELEAERHKCSRELAAEGEPIPAPALHPNLPEIYRRKVAKLEEALNDPRTQAEATGAIRLLIDAVVLHPGDRRGEVRAELCGELAALLELGQEHKAKTRVGETRVSLVAGTCNHREHTVCVEV